jgi:HD-GYP domain-containing protein (c-di-GMP phosphodiesterase class II)
MTQVARKLAFAGRTARPAPIVSAAAEVDSVTRWDRQAFEQASYAAIRLLSLTSEAGNVYMHGHSLRVRAWATTLAAELGLAGSRLKTLTLAAELHDVGIPTIPEGILSADRPLTPRERDLVGDHPRRGVELVRHLTFLVPACEAILHHHERLDGTGYPGGLAGDQISLEARVLAVVDAYDAMTSCRPYRSPLSHTDAVAELRRCSGIQFDPRCVETFLGLVG